MKRKRIKATVVFDIEYAGKFTKRDMEQFAKEIVYNHEFSGWDHTIETSLISSDVEFVKDE